MHCTVYLRAKSEKTKMDQKWTNNNHILLPNTSSFNFLLAKKILEEILHQCCIHSMKEKTVHLKTITKYPRVKATYQCSQCSYYTRYDKLTAAVLLPY